MDQTDTDLTTRPEGPDADTRDMVPVHDMFRRQFRWLPELLESVPVDDRDRVRVVTDHAAFLTMLLHAHHGSEDAVVWPRVEARGQGADIELSEIMEAQHERIDHALQTLDRTTAALAEAPSAATREAAATAAREAVPTLEEHLALEEAEMLVVIERHLTQAEWDTVAGHSLATVEEAMFPVLFGMVLEDITAEKLAAFSHPIPPDLMAAMSEAGPAAYAAHRARLQEAIGS
jgi:DUF438 domain-containing protein